jgi:UDP-N-acetylmuramoylalanine--D-glutamate ligase
MFQSKIAILGAGESGVGTAILAKKEGYEVFVSDRGTIAPQYKSLMEQNQIAYEEGAHSDELILDATIVMKSPGIPNNADIVQKIKNKGIQIMSELEFAYPFCKGKIIGITGSNGKTTTTNLIYHIYQQAGRNVGMCGNVGVSFAQMIAMDPKDYYIVEISSFQLDDIKDFRCHTAILLNITPDHLDRYDYKMENYVKSKFNIVTNQMEEDVFIYCADDIEIKNFMAKSEHNIRSKKIPFSYQHQLDFGGYIQQDQLIINIQQPIFSMLVQDITIKGKHNQHNTLAAGIAAKIDGLKNEDLKEAFASFKSIPHRLESVLQIQGVEYINDSKATNVNSSWYALECMDKKVVWIVGGVDKGNDYEVLLPLVKKKVKAIVCLGLDNLKIHNTFSGIVDVIVNVESMKDAVRSSSQMAAKGDAVLLSPCCASFDLFQNYEDRGDQFKKCVREL